MESLSNMHKKHVSAIILAAGSGKRVGGDIKKQYIELMGVPLICHTISVFENYTDIDDIILVVPKGDEEYVKRDIVQKYGFAKIRAVICGGSERYFSVAKGLEYIEKNILCRSHEAAELVMIHDGARPFLKENILKRICDGFENAASSNAPFACAVAVKVKDSLKYADTDGNVLKSLDRDYIYAMQTPQAFSFSIIAKAYRKLVSETEKSEEKLDITDDAMALERYCPQYKIRLLEGSYNNFKITTAEDIKYAEFLLKNSERSC